MDAPDPKRSWIGLGSEATGTMAGCALVGWWLMRHFGSPVPFVVAAITGVVLVVWRMLSSAR